jgi:hypothetical protein
MRRRATGFTLIEIIVPQMQEKQKRFTCANNLSQLGGMFVAERAEKSGKPKYDGQALWLSWRIGGKKIKEGQEGILICPGDNGITAADTPEAKARYNDVDLKNPPDDMCSYTARDFTGSPLSNESPKLQIIACDRNGPDGRTAHHKNGLNIVFEDGSASFFEREALGISGDDPIVVGPDSSNEMLKQVIFNKAHKD